MRGDHRQGLTEYEQLRVEIAYKFSPNGTEADADEHLDHLRRVVDQYPNADDARILGDLYAGRRDLANAERAYRLIIALDPARSDGYENVIITLLRASESEMRDERSTPTRRDSTRGSRIAFDVLVSYAEARLDRAAKMSST